MLLKHIIVAFVCNFIRLGANLAHIRYVNVQGLLLQAFKLYYDYNLTKELIYPLFCKRGFFDHALV